MTGLITPTGAILRKTFSPSYGNTQGSPVQSGTWPSSGVAFVDGESLVLDFGAGVQAVLNGIKFKMNVVVPNNIPIGGSNDKWTSATSGNGATIGGPFGALNLGTFTLYGSQDGLNYDNLGSSVPTATWDSETNAGTYLENDAFGQPTCSWSNGAFYRYYKITVTAPATSVVIYSLNTSTHVISQDTATITYGDTLTRSMAGLGPGAA